ncbi:MAG: hypothetical protein HY006_03500 [Candidatus Sungbacteria bacterium]|nr:hypothetical protein [Candidatus Sungbacteria bacterium]
MDIALVLFAWSILAAAALGLLWLAGACICGFCQDYQRRKQYRMEEERVTEGRQDASVMAAWFGLYRPPAYEAVDARKFAERVAQILELRPETPDTLFLWRKVRESLDADTVELPPMLVPESEDFVAYRYAIGQVAKLPIHTTTPALA